MAHKPKIESSDLYRYHRERDMNLAQSTDDEAGLGCEKVWLTDTH